jgi:hypothetical protein
MSKTMHIVPPLFFFPILPFPFLHTSLRGPISSEGARVDVQGEGGAQVDAACGCRRAERRAWLAAAQAASDVAREAQGGECGLLLCLRTPV